MIRACTADLVVSIALLLIGLYVAYGGIGYGFADEGVPAAGFFPFWVGGGIALTSALNILRNLRGRVMDYDIPIDEVVRVALASLAMVLFVVVSAYVGMLPAAFLLMLGIGLLFGPRTTSFHIRLLGVVALTTALLWLVFAKLLAVPLA